jgi:hypothetical protein
MADLSQLSDADLMSALGGGSAVPSLQSLSDADLLKALGQQPQNVSTMGDVAKSAGIGLAKGAIGLAGLPGDAADLASRGYDYMTGSDTNSTVHPYAQAIGSDNIQKHIENYTGQFYQPKTTAGEYAQTMGEFAPALFGGPESIATKLATRVAAPALASETAGQLTKGTSLEPYARVAGAVVGAGLPVAASRVISPTTIDAANAGAVNTLKNEGVTALTAGQKSGSRVMKYMESELGDSLGAGNSATKANELAHEQFTQAALKRAGVDAPRATPEVVDQAFTDNSNLFNSVAAKNPEIPISGDFWKKADDVANEYKNLTGQESPLLKQTIERLKGEGGEVPITSWPQDKQNLVSQLKAQGVSDADIANTLGIAPATSGTIPKAISGEAYQGIQSDMARLARKASQPELKMALYDLRATLDKEVGNGLKQMGNAQDYKTWQDARSQYKNLLVIERAIGKDSEMASKGLISPAALGSADRAINGRRAFVRGNSGYGDLAQAGNAVMKPLPQSGTAPRAAAHLLPSIIGAGIGAGLGDLTGIAGGVAGPALLGRAIMSKPVQRYLSNQRAVGLRQIPVGRNALTGGILALPSAQSR